MSLINKEQVKSYHLQVSYSHPIADPPHHDQIEQHTYKFEDSLITSFKSSKRKKDDHKLNNCFSFELAAATAAAAAEVESLEDILYDPRDMNVHQVVLPVKGLWIKAKGLISFYSSISHRHPQRLRVRIIIAKYS